MVFLHKQFEWKNQPISSTIEGERLSISAGAQTDWFVDPAGGMSKVNAPAALFALADAHFVLSARVTVDFASTYDAGVLVIYERDDCWAKLCFEYSPQRQPMVVSVVTRGTSDDCSSAIIDGCSVYLRLYYHGPALAFHYSLDGAYWHLVRHFALGALAQPRIGFLAQSPTGAGCAVAFDHAVYKATTLADLRSGD